MGDDDESRFAWRALRSEALFATPYYTVYLDRLLHPAGHELDYYVVRPSRMAVGVVPVGEDGRVLLVRQWRHTVQKVLWEVPAGAMDPGESPEEAARRELLEETGCEAGSVEPLYRYHPTIGTSSQTFHLFVARGLRQVGRHDPKEILELGWFTKQQVQGMLDRQEIGDGMSLTSLLLCLRERLR